MAICKEAFYEGSALYFLARTGNVKNIRHNSPFYVGNNRIHVLIKYSTANRSPWGFTFTPEDQSRLTNKATTNAVVIGLICGSDGVATLAYKSYREIVIDKEASIRISCFRKHGEHYEISGPEGVLDRKIPPSMWQRILDPPGEK